MHDAERCGGTPGHPALITLASTPAGDQTVDCSGCPDCEDTCGSCGSPIDPVSGRSTYDFDVNVPIAELRSELTRLREGLERVTGGLGEIEAHLRMKDDDSLHELADGLACNRGELAALLTHGAIE